MSAMKSIPNPSGHPARFSGAIVDKLRELLVFEYEDDKPYIFDPFAGTGERLAELLGTEFDGGGIELYRDFIVNKKLVKVGDATNPDIYPTTRFVIVTSPVYPNGMAEEWRVSGEDASKRNTYAAARKTRTKRNDMGVLGYRGTKRGGRSQKRAKYWSVAEAAVETWTRNLHCEAIYLNVSDFMSAGVVEPFVEDWRGLLHRHGWQQRAAYDVSTPRHRGNDNADQRVCSEQIVHAVRSAHTS